MISKELLKKYAELAIKVGINLQKDQMLVINAPVECKDLARELNASAYRAGASNVIVKWNDEIIDKEYYLNASLETVKEVPDYVVSQAHYFVDKNAAFISISAPTPGLLKEVDPQKLMASSKAFSEKLDFYRAHTMSNGSQWLVIAAPTEKWAQKVFPNDDCETAFDKLWDAILKACRVTSDNDPVTEWNMHMENLSKHNSILNDYDFDKLYFKNSKGTDLEVKLVDGHIWGGGGENSQKNVFFAPNIPTEETFTMPHSHGVNGKVVSSMPLNYQGKLIENFYLVFKDGKVVDFKAEKEQEALSQLLSIDEGSSRLGEVALISYNSPISNMGILFYNTLFDENASCHLALGNAYTMNIKDGYNLNEEELMKKGYNKSNIHIDFMFGSDDMEIIGVKKNGEKIQIFHNGNFVF